MVVSNHQPAIALASSFGTSLRPVAPGTFALIRTDAVWMATEPLAMRAGPKTFLARVVRVFGAAHPHHFYLQLCANPPATWMKVLVHDGVGVWLAARTLKTGQFIWGDARRSPEMPRNAAPLSALAFG